MAKVLLCLQRPTASSLKQRTSLVFCRRFLQTINTSTFAEGDRVILIARSHKSKLTGPLRHGAQTQFSTDSVSHDSIIGKSNRDVVWGSKSTSYRIANPSLEDYLLLTPRKVTPIYPADASLIVSLLDIHVSPYNSAASAAPPLEILEAGTGHGSLTLYLARAVHAANPPPPSYPPPRPSAASLRELYNEGFGTTERQGGTSFQTGNGNQKREEELENWRNRRGAIIHTIDISKSYSAHAETTVRGFRQGLYAGSVDFHVSHIEDWILNQIRLRQGGSAAITTAESTIPPSPSPFISHAILDMPSADKQLPVVVPVLRPNGLIAVFVPSISQIAECEKLAYEMKLRLSLEKVVELGTGISGGRLWDVRFTRVRSQIRRNSSGTPREQQSTTTTTTTTRFSEAADIATTATSSPLEPESVEENEERGGNDGPGIGSGDTAQESAPVTDSENMSESGEKVLVCRPKVGDRIVGGGFVGIWRKMTD